MVISQILPLISQEVFFSPTYLDFKKLLNVLLPFFFKLFEAPLKRKIRRKSKWYLGTITKRRRISRAKDDGQNVVDDKIENDTEENQDTSVDHNAAGDIGESSIEENEKQQNASESKMELGNNYSSTCFENQVEESGKTIACTELRKDKITCNGDASGSEIADTSDENEAKGKSQSSNLLILKDVSFKVLK